MGRGPNPPQFPQDADIFEVDDDCLIIASSRNPRHDLEPPKTRRRDRGKRSKGEARLPEIGEESAGIIWCDAEEEIPEEEIDEAVLLEVLRTHGMDFRTFVATAFGRPRKVESERRCCRRVVGALERIYYGRPQSRCETELLAGTDDAIAMDRAARKGEADWRVEDDGTFRATYKFRSWHFGCAPTSVALIPLIAAPDAMDGSFPIYVHRVHVDRDGTAIMTFQWLYTADDLRFQGSNKLPRDFRPNELALGSQCLTTPVEYVRDAAIVHFDFGISDDFLDSSSTTTTSSDGCGSDSCLFQRIDSIHARFYCHRVFNEDHPSRQLKLLTRRHCGAFQSSQE